MSTRNLILQNSSPSACCSGCGTPAKPVSKDVIIMCRDNSSEQVLMVVDTSGMRPVLHYFNFNGSLYTGNTSQLKPCGGTGTGGTINTTGLDYEIDFICVDNETWRMVTVFDPTSTAIIVNTLYIDPGNVVRPAPTSFKVGACVPPLLLDEISRTLTPHAEVVEGPAVGIIPDRVKSFTISNLGEYGDASVFTHVDIEGLAGTTYIPKVIATFSHSVDESQDYLAGPITVKPAINHQVLIQYNF